jgi:DUF1680 family protein
VRFYSTEPPATHGASLVALPYYLWANRTPGSMQVWLTEVEGLSALTGPST